MNIYFIRHGEGYHNLKKNGQSQHHLLYPTLTAKGISQCVNTCNNLKHVHFDLVIVSPLIRTIQTFDYVFFERNYQNAVSIDLFREIIHSPCDYRQDIKKIKSNHSHLRFSGFDENELNVNQKENNDDVKNRVQRIKALLSKLKQKKINNVAIVTHGALLYRLCKEYNGIETKFFKNAEYRILKS